MTESYLYMQFYQCIKVNNQHGLNRETLGKLVLKNSETVTTRTVPIHMVG